MIRILEIIKSTSSALLSNKKHSPLTDTQIIAAVEALSDSNTTCLAFASRLIKGDMPVETESLFLHNLNEMRPFTVIASSLEKSHQIALLDWAESLENSAKTFAELFGRAGLDSAPILNELVKVEEPERGFGVGIAYTEFRKLADAFEKLIVGLNVNSDSYLFILAEKDKVQPWINVEIDQRQFIENSDWQFAEILAQNGLEVRSSKHPSRLKRPAPNNA
ncbi:MAG: hypothetical protein AAF700_11215 [Pseudomonadota bacterium]